VLTVGASVCVKYDQWVLGMISMC